MNRTFLITASIVLGLAACAPKPKEEAKAPEAAAAPAAQAPDVAAAAAKGDADPRIPTVDPATINDKSSVADVMHAYVIPGSETLFAAESEDAPKDDAGWAKLRSAAQDVITGSVIDVVDKALAFQKNDRWPDARAMQQAVRGCYERAADPIARRSPISFGAAALPTQVGSELPADGVEEPVSVVFDAAENGGETTSATRRWRSGSPCPFSASAAFPSG